MPSLIIIYFFMVFKSVVQNNNFRLGYTELKFL